MATIFEKISDGRTDLILDYIENEGSINDVDQYGTSLIKLAAYYGDVTAIKFLITKGAALEDLGENFDLNGAAFHGHWQLCQYLLENGANPNSRLSNGETPLHSAISKANNRNTLYVVQLLLAHGADPNARTVAGEESGSFMRDAHTYEETPLHRAAAFGNDDLIHTLLDAGADKSITDARGDSPLSWASWHLRPGKILSLLTFGNHKLHPAHVKRIQGDHGYGYGACTMTGLVGKIHLK